MAANLIQSTFKCYLARLESEAILIEKVYRGKVSYPGLVLGFMFYQGHQGRMTFQKVFDQEQLRLNSKVHFADTIF